MNNNEMINKTMNAIPLIKRSYVMSYIEDIHHYTSQVDNITLYIYVGKVNGYLTKYISPSIKWNGYLEIMFSIDDNEIVYFSDENEIFVWESDEEEYYKY